MPIDIEPFYGQTNEMRLSVPPKARVKLGKTPPDTIPEGHDATFCIGGIMFSAHDFRERPGHTPGAVVEGDGVTVELDPENNANAIAMNIFRYRKS